MVDKNTRYNSKQLAREHSREGDWMIIKRGMLKKIYRALILFLFFFDISFIGIPSLISTRKIVFVFLVFYAFRNKLRVVPDNLKKWKVLFVSNIVILIYLFVISSIMGVLGNSMSAIPNFIYFMIYTLLGALFLANYFDNIYGFMEATIGAMWIQAIFVFVEFFSKAVRQAVSSIVIPTGNVDYVSSVRGNGLGAEAANLTLLLFLAVFCCNFIIINRGIRLKYIISQVVMLAAMILVGKTGLLVSFFFIAYTVMIVLPKTGKIIPAIKMTCIFSVLVILGVLILKNIMTEADFYRQFYKFYYAITDFSSNDSVNRFKEFLIPPLTAETMIGTGIIRGYTKSGLYLWNDSGYIQMYSSIGLVFAIIFYSVLFGTIYKMIKDCVYSVDKEIINFMRMYLLTLMIIEIKEPFVFKYVLPMFLLVIIMLIQRSNNNECTQ